MFSGVEKKKKKTKLMVRFSHFISSQKNKKFLRFNIKWTLVPFGGVRGGGSQNQ